MTDRHDESQLLALIEGELDQHEASALRQRLASDPQVHATVEAMVRDRSALRSLDEPALPCDFLAQIEPMLARPMLMEPVAELATLKPGEFRRRHRKANRQRRFGRLAAAAAIMLAVLGGAWAGFVGLIGNQGNGGTSFAHNTQQPSLEARRSALASGEAQPTPDASLADRLGPGAVHHDRPPADLLHRAIASGAATAQPADGPTPALADANPVIAVDFALVLEGRDPAAVEAAMSRAVATLDHRSALVKNFSFAEAQRLAEEYRLAHGGAAAARDPALASAANDVGGERPRLTAPMSAADLYQLAQRVREQLRERAARGEPARTETLNGNGVIASDGATRLTRTGGAANDGSAMITGEPGLGPTLEQQLGFSSRGATHTIAVPASEVVNLIERLALDEGQPTMLEMLPPPPALQDVLIANQASGRRGAASSRDSAPPPPAPTMVWLTEGPRVRQAMSRLSQARGDAIVLLPVIVK